MGPAGISQKLSGEPAAKDFSRSSGTGLPSQLVTKDPVEGGDGAVRLDVFLARRGFFASREKAQRGIRSGVVQVEGAITTRSSQRVPPTVRIEIVTSREGVYSLESAFVSRSGAKLAAALDHLGLDPEGWACLDVGASTGGFTDCLLQRGAARVYAVDVGHGQLVERLRQDPRVISWEGVNARSLPADLLPQPCQLVVVDLSFISVLKVLPALLPHLRPGGYLVPLIKPQFEVGPGGVGKGGVVRNEDLRRAVIQQRVGEIAALGLEVVAEAFDCALAGSDGNREAFAGFQRRSP